MSERNDERDDTGEPPPTLDRRRARRMAFAIRWMKLARERQSDAPVEHHAPPVTKKMADRVAQALDVGSTATGAFQSPTIPAPHVIEQSRVAHR